MEIFGIIAIVLLVIIIGWILFFLYVLKHHTIELTDDSPFYEDEIEMEGREKIKIKEVNKK